MDCTAPPGSYCPPGTRAILAAAAREHVHVRRCGGTCTSDDGHVHVRRCGGAGVDEGARVCMWLRGGGQGRGKRRGSGALKGRGARGAPATGKPARRRLAPSVRWAARLRGASNVLSACSALALAPPLVRQAPLLHQPLPHLPHSPASLFALQGLRVCGLRVQGGGWRFGSVGRGVRAALKGSDARRRCGGSGLHVRRWTLLPQGVGGGGGGGLSCGILVRGGDQGQGAVHVPPWQVL
jgi:hypothetical protein